MAGPTPRRGSPAQLTDHPSPTAIASRPPPFSAAGWEGADRPQTRPGPAQRRPRGARPPPPIKGTAGRCRARGDPTTQPGPGEPGAREGWSPGGHRHAGRPAICCQAGTCWWILCRPGKLRHGAPGARSGGGRRSTRASPVRAVWKPGSCPRELPGQRNPQSLGGASGGAPAPLQARDITRLPPAERLLHLCPSRTDLLRWHCCSPHTGRCWPCSGPVARSSCPTNPMDKCWCVHVCSWLGPPCLLQAALPAQL